MALKYLVQLTKIIAKKHKTFNQVMARERERGERERERGGGGGGER